ncbi:MAG: hypothetical protein AAF623_16890 [Planctomycetota bacterium]
MSGSQRNHGTYSDIAMPGDFDGDGKTDRAIWNGKNLIRQFW